jgi:signal transduction histidine kinase
MHPILADRQRLRLHLIAWALVGVMLGLLVRAVIGTRWSDALIFALPLGLVAAPVSLSAWYLCRAMPLGRTSAIRVAGTALVAAMVTSALWAGAGSVWWSTLRRAGVPLVDAPAALTALLAGLGALAYLLAVTVHYLLQAFEESAAAERRALEAQIAHREAELRALRAQVDPHFLFNSLNSVSGLIAADPKRAREMCRLLADFLRESLTLGGVARIPLGRETALAHRYLEIEHVRFGQRLTVQMRIADDAAEAAVPPLILQPLVENAVRHGIATRLEGGEVEILAHVAGPRVVISVANPRDADAVRRGTGFGLDIVRRRLAATFGDRASISVEAAADHYRVSLTLPLEETAS